MLNWFTVRTSLVCALLTAPAFAQTIEKKSLSLDGAKAILAACEAEATKLKAGGAIAVVDDGGNLIAVHRIDGTFAAASNVSIGKARTAAMFRKPTSAFEQIIRDGRTPMLALHDFTPLQGGVPIIIDGQVVGAVGMSGAASAQQDEEIAKIGVAAVTTKTAAATESADIPPASDVAAKSPGLPAQPAAKPANESNSETPSQGVVVRKPHGGMTLVTTRTAKENSR